MTGRLKKNIIYCNETKYFLRYERTCVLSVCIEDFANKKYSGIPNVFVILLYLKIFLKRFQTTVYIMSKLGNYSEL